MNSSCKPDRSDATRHLASVEDDPRTLCVRLVDGGEFLMPFLFGNEAADVLADLDGVAFGPTGERLDGSKELEPCSETGLLCFGARSYDPTPGRWTTEDAVRFAAGDTNLYRYCHAPSPAQ